MSSRFPPCGFACASDTLLAMATRKQWESSFLGRDNPKLVVTFLGGAERRSVRIREHLVEGTIKLREVRGARWVLLNFVNCPPNPEGIAKFTADYGPLRSSRAVGFSFQLGEWKKEQLRMQRTWNLHGQQTPGIKLLAETPRAVPLERHSLVFEHGEARLKANSLLEFIQMGLDIWNPDALRICPNPMCPAPFFIKTRKNSIYCGRAECKQWGKNRQNLALYHRHKEEWPSTSRRRAH